MSNPKKGKFFLQKGEIFFLQSRPAYLWMVTFHLQEAGRCGEGTSIKHQGTR